jgi:hypothetical protein
MLLNEIESVNVKFNDITNVLNRLSGQASDRMNEAQLIIGEARKAVDKGDSTKIVKKGEAPKAEFKAAEAPKSNLSDIPSAPKNLGNSSDPFAGIGSSQSYNSVNNNNSNANKPASVPSQSAAPQQPKQPAKKSTNFNFDMAELLKAAEEEAAKEESES